MRLRPTNLWHNSDFLKLWIGQTISEIGSRVTLVALPLVAVLVLNANPFQMGLFAGIGVSHPLFSDWEPDSWWIGYGAGQFSSSLTWAERWFWDQSRSRRRSEY